MSVDQASYERNKAMCNAVFQRVDGQLTPDPYTEISDSYITPLEALSQRMYAAWVNEATIPEKNSLALGGIEHGFNVIGRGLQRCLEAYTASCSSTGEQGSDQDFIDALKDARTIKTFVWIASSGPYMHKPYEQWLGLNASRSVTTEEFMLVRDEDGAYFQPNGDILDVADSEARSYARSKDASTTMPRPQHEVCSARHYIPKVWLDMVDAAQAEGLLGIAESANV